MTNKLTKQNHIIKKSCKSLDFFLSLQKHNFCRLTLLHIHYFISRIGEEIESIKHISMYRYLLHSDDEEDLKNVKLASYFTLTGRCTKIFLETALVSIKNTLLKMIMLRALINSKFINVFCPR